MAANKGFIATDNFTCHRCGKGIDAGSHWMIFYNKPVSRTPFHVNCDMPGADSTEFVEPVASNGNGKNSVEDAIKQLILATQTKQETDADRVKAIVLEELAKVTLPTVVEIRQEGKEPKTLKSTHKQFQKLLKTAVRNRKNTYLYGATQGGKSTAAVQVAEALELPYYSICLNIQSQPSLITGYKNASTGEYVEVDFFKWYTGGGVYHLEEYDNATGNFQTTLNDALANGYFAFPCGRMKRHPDAICIASGNTTGLGANRTYTSRQVMDEASRGRFIFIKWEYDTQLEMALAKAMNPEHGEIWCTWVQLVREYLKQTKVDRPVATPQTSKEGADFLNVFPAEEVADMVFFKGCEDDLKAKILASAPLPKIGVAHA